MPLPGTRAVLFPHPGRADFVRLQVNVRWNLTKEDLLNFIVTGHARMGRKEQRHDPFVSPSLTRQEPYLGAIIALLGGRDTPEVAAVRAVQTGCRDRNPYMAG